MRANKLKKILILVTILAVPGFLYYLLQDQGKNRYHPLPFFGPKKLAGTSHSVRGVDIPDTIYHQLSDFKFIDEAGDSISRKQLSDKIVVLNLFQAEKLGDSADRSMTAMKKLAHLYARNKFIQFLSVNVNPATGLPQLKAYADFIGLLPNWHLLSGPSSQLEPFIKDGLFLDAFRSQQDGAERFVYSNMIVLLDRSQRIRGYYEATNNEALTKLDDEIKVLIVEELRNMDDGR